MKKLLSFLYLLGISGISLLVAESITISIPLLLSFGYFIIFDIPLNDSSSLTQLVVIGAFILTYVMVLIVWFFAAKAYVKSVESWHLPKLNKWIVVIVSGFVISFSITQVFIRNKIEQYHLDQYARQYEAFNPNIRIVKESMTYNTSLRSDYQGGYVYHFSIDVHNNTPYTLYEMIDIQPGIGPGGIVVYGESHFDFHPNDAHGGNIYPGSNIINGDFAITGGKNIDILKSGNIPVKITFLDNFTTDRIAYTYSSLPDWAKVYAQ